MVIVIGDGVCNLVQEGYLVSFQFGATCMIYSWTVIAIMWIKPFLMDQFMSID